MSQWHDQLLDGLDDLQRCFEEFSYPEACAFYHRNAHVAANLNASFDERRRAALATLIADCLSEDNPIDRDLLYEWIKADPQLDTISQVRICDARPRRPRKQSEKSTV